MENDLQKKVIRTFVKNRAAVVGLVMAVVVVAICLLAPVLPIEDPYEYSLDERFRPPGADHAFGTDYMGRDILSRIIWGGRISILVGVLSVGLAITLGTIIGLISGYKGGWLDNTVMRLIDVLMAFPTLLLGILFMAALGSGLSSIIIAIGLAVTPRLARLCRAEVLSVKEKDFIDVARSMGFIDSRIIFVHVLPNILGNIVVMASLWVGAIILVEASLSFLGLGVPPPIPSWGRMVREGMDFLTHAPWVSIYTGLAILITVIAFNLVGDGLRDILDPKLRR